MIDYLERLFVSDKREWEGEQEDTVPSRPLTEEEPQGMKSAEIRAEQPQNMAAVSLSTQENEESRVSYLPEEAANHSGKPRSGAWEENFAASEEPLSEERSARLPGRYRPEEGDEPLEHRLRRNSRRYDSGFFLY